jgi:hypothetical protein
MVYFDRHEPTRNPAPSLLPVSNLDEALEQIASDDEVLDLSMGMLPLVACHVTTTHVV